MLPFLRDADSKVVVATVKAASPCVTAPGATAGTANQAGHPLSSPASLQPATCGTQMQQEPPARGLPVDTDTQMRDIPAGDGEGGVHGKQQADGTGPAAGGWCTQQVMCVAMIWNECGPPGAVGEDLLEVLSLQHIAAPPCDGETVTDELLASHRKYCEDRGKCASVFSCGFCSGSYRSAAPLATRMESC